MISNLLNLFLFLAASLGLFFTGRALLSFADFKLTPVERLTLSFVLGALTVSTLFTALGFAGLFTEGVGFTVLAFSLTAAAYQPRVLRKELGEFYKSVRGFIKYTTTVERRIAVAIIVVLAAAFFVVAFGPELRNDALWYHLELPKRYIDNGIISFQYDIHQSSFPQAWNMLYAYGLLLGSDQISRLFAFAASLCLILTAYSAGRRLFGKSAGLYAAVTIATTPLFAAYWSNAMSDVPFALFLTLGVFALLIGRKNPIAAAVIAGFFLGFAAGSRMQWLVLAPVLVIVYGAVLISAGFNIKRSVGMLVIVFSLAFFFALPYYINNYAATGSFTGYTVHDVVRYEEWERGSEVNSFFDAVIAFLSTGNYRGPKGPWYYKLLIPLYITFKPNLWGQGIPGPLYLALIPGIIFVRSRFFTASLLLIFVVLILIAWVLLLKETSIRYLMPAVLPAALVAGYVWSWFFKSGKTGKTIGRFVLLCAVGISVFFVCHVAEYFPVVAGFRNPRSLITERVFADFDAVKAVNSLPPGSKVLSWDMRVFYFDTPVILGRPKHSGTGGSYFDTTRMETPGEMLEWSAEHGVTHVLAVSDESDFTFPGKPFRNPNGKYHFRDDFLDVYGVILAEGGREGVKGGYYTLYEMRYP